MMSVSIRTGATIEAGAPKPLFAYGEPGGGNRFAVSSDGQRFLIMDWEKSNNTPKDKVVVLNWSAS